MIVLLMGSGPDRMLQAVDLYNEGYSGEIIMVRNMVRGYDMVAIMGVEIPLDTEIMKVVVAQLGVDADDIKIIPGDALSAQDEAISVRANRSKRGC
jgi:hypothetical protein